MRDDSAKKGLGVVDLLRPLYPDRQSTDTVNQGGNTGGTNNTGVLISMFNRNSQNNSSDNKNKRSNAWDYGTAGAVAVTAVAVIGVAAYYLQPSSEASNDESSLRERTSQKDGQADDVKIRTEKKSTTTIVEEVEQITEATGSDGHKTVVRSRASKMATRTTEVSIGASLGKGTKTRCSKRSATEKDKIMRDIIAELDSIDGEV